MNKKEFVRWKEKIKEFKQDKMRNKRGFIYTIGFPKGCTVDSIEVKAREIEQKLGKPIHIIVIDYLNDITPKGTYSSSKDWSGQGDISWDMCGIAKSWDRNRGIPVITANQGKTASSLSKFKTTSGGLVYFKKMYWDDAAFSPLPAQHATLILGLLHSKADENNIANMVNHQVVKNRDGETIRGVLSFPKLATCRMNSLFSYNRARENFENLVKDVNDNESMIDLK